MAEMTLGIGSRIQHPQWGQGVITGVKYETYFITFIDHGTKEIEKDNSMLDVIEAANVTTEIATTSEVENSLIGILRLWSDVSEVVPLGDKWKGGVMELRPYDKTMKPKEIPIETFFHKIVMLRDRLRVLEQNINSHPKLNDEDKVNLQQYITRIYGSLTTFNVMFRQKEHQFVGEKGKED